MASKQILTGRADITVNAIMLQVVLDIHQVTYVTAVKLPKSSAYSIARCDSVVVGSYHIPNLGFSSSNMTTKQLDLL